MRSRIWPYVLIAIALATGCSKPASETSSAQAAQEQGATTVGPDVGAVTPVTGTSLDDASGGGVNSAAMKKAKGVAAQGVGSVNNAERQGYGAEGD